MKKVITINIGQNGALLSLINDSEVFDELFVHGFNVETMASVEYFFNKYKKNDVHLILDTLAQNFTLRTFPAMNYFDTQSVVERKFAYEIPKDHLKFKKFLYKDIEGNSVYLFASSSLESPLKEWLDFLKNIPNMVKSVYMLPLETSKFTKKIISAEKIKKTDIKEWVIVTFDNSVSGVRQTVFYNNDIVLTRFVYNKVLEAENSYRNELLKVIEYIKRIDSNFIVENLFIINILSEVSISILKNLKIEGAEIKTYTPKKVAELLKIPTKFVSRKDNFLDLVLSFLMIKNPVHKFIIEDLKTVTNLILIALVLKFLFFGTFILNVIVFIYASVYSLSQKINLSKLENNIKENEIALKTKFDSLFKVTEDEIEKIIDFGSMDEFIKKKEVSPIDDFIKFNKVTYDLILVQEIKWKHVYFYNDSFGQVNINYSSNLLNPAANVDKLFEKEKMLKNNLNKEFGSNLVKINEIPTNINFNERHYLYPLKMEISFGGNK